MPDVRPAPSAAMPEGPHHLIEATPPAAADLAAGLSVADELVAARAAFDRHAWQDAFDILSAVDASAPDALTATDLEALALAAFFVAKPEIQTAAKERAFRRHETDGNALRAAYIAADIARFYGYSGKQAIASAWKRRAERLIGTEGETYAHGYLALIGSESAASHGDLDAALALAERAVAIGAGTQDADLTATAQVNLGTLKIATGATADGFALMEEASIAAVNGDLSPFESGVTACRMIGACRDVTDYRRASEWIEATEKYCDRMSLDGFPGICRIHRAEVVAVGGGWDRAEEMLRLATAELETFQATPPQADGFYALGDVRRLRGDFEGAEAALREAHLRGRSPQPALALIRLAQGQAKVAAAAIQSALADESWDRWARARLLPAQAEIAIAAGDIQTARAASQELVATVAGYPSPALAAGSVIATARVLLAEGDARGAVQEIRTGLRQWREVGAPYEVARARRLLARALREAGDEDDADLELSAAIDELRRLGAKPDLEAAEGDLREVVERRAGPQTARRTFMFTDIVGSTGLAEALGDDAWERLLRWHDDTLRALVTRGGGEIVNTTGDGLFAAFESGRAAALAAIAIQAALRDQRDATGFALSVRIGLHTADANRRGPNYTGMGVHVAARIGAMATGGEILASAATLNEADVPTTGDRREELVRGVSAPVTIGAIRWAG